MKKLIALALAASAVFAASAPVPAAGGCGRAFHRGAYGRCVSNFRGPRAGGYYHGRGYYDGRRYYQHRYRHQGGWRYR